ncbi:NAD(P)-dependent oxidoreductase [Pseudonocardia sp. CA-107938]|uniref:NAD(P)-dependent oxidoreductase n=1 Tax=Pseudonocardia sp. CA-107938 TaxID=3240021 RepID=UPI003D8FFFE3
MSTDVGVREVTGPLDPADAVVGIIGVGDMGEGIANSLLRNGWTVLAYARRAGVLDAIVEQGARVAGTPADLAAGSDVVLVVVTDDEQVTAVIRQMLPHARPGTVFLVCSTVLPSTITSIADEARAAGTDVVDAGVAGGREKADLGLLTVMIGGEDGSVARCMPVIASFGANPFHLGPAGAGVAGKLVNNVLVGGTQALAIEAMRLGAAYGITEDRLTEIVTVSGGDSKVIRTWGRYDRVRRDFWPGRPRSEVYEYVCKDLRNAAVAGGQRKLVLPLISTAGQLLPSMFAERDALLADTDLDAIPRCSRCNQELSVTYRERGVHPECVFFDL